MSDTTSLELSKALYELSGWQTLLWWTCTDGYPNELSQNGWVPLDKYNVPSGVKYPAYDAGYLLRKLPAVIGRNDDFSLVQHKWSESTYHAGYYAFDDMTTLSHLFFEEATTPEDALCKLAIELHKAGILPISGRDL